MSKRKSIASKATINAEDDADDKNRRNLIFFEVDEDGIITDPNFEVPKLNGELFDSISVDELTTPENIIYEIEFCDALIEHFRWLARDEEDELIRRIELQDFRDGKERQRMKCLAEALKDEDSGWKKWIKIEGKQGVPRFRKEILDWLAAPIEWGEDMPDKATARGYAKHFFEHDFDDTNRDALGVSIVEFSTAYNTFGAAVLEKKVEEANEIAQKQGQWFRFRLKSEEKK